MPNTNAGGVLGMTLEVAEGLYTGASIEERLVRITGDDSEANLFGVMADEEPAYLLASKRNSLLSFLSLLWRTLSRVNPVRLMSAGITESPEDMLVSQAAISCIHLGF